MHTSRTELALCRCLGISEDEVVTAIQVFDLETVGDVRRCTGAGTGCTSCLRAIAACLTECRANLRDESCQMAGS